MNNKVFIYLVVLVLLVAGLAFSYKKFAVDQQRQKEVEIIKAQLEKDRSILEDKQKEKDKQTRLLEECIAKARETLNQTLEAWKRQGLATDNLEDLKKKCGTYPTVPAQTQCYKTNSELLQDATKDFKSEEERCHNFYD